MISNDNSNREKKSEGDVSSTFWNIPEDDFIQDNNIIIIIKIILLLSDNIIIDRKSCTAMLFYPNYD